MRKRCTSRAISLNVLITIPVTICTGEPVIIKNAICLHEEDDGMSWKHTDMYAAYICLVAKCKKTKSNLKALQAQIA